MSDVTKTSHIETIRANYQRRAELAESIRESAAKATEEKRALTAEEAADVERFSTELADVDKRILGQLDNETRRQQVVDGVDGLLGAALSHTGEIVDTRSIGQKFIESDEFEAFAAAGAQGSYRQNFDGVSLRALTSVDASSNPYAGVPMLPRVGSDVKDRQVFLSDLLPVIPVTTGVVEYVQDKTALGGYDAAETAEGNTKPEATPTLTVVTETTATVAVHTGLTRQVFSDWGQVPGYLDGRLRYGLRRRVDNQIVAGNGTAPNLKGLQNRSGIKAYAAAAIEEAAISVRKAITVGQQSDAVYEIIVMNPGDAEKFDLLNAATAGLHSTPDTVSQMPRTAWGLTRVVTNAVASGTALLIDPMSASLLDRQQPTAYLTDSHASEFTSNVLRLLLETRVGLALFDPAGVCKVTFKYS